MTASLTERHPAPAGPAAPDTMVTMVTRVTRVTRVGAAVIGATGYAGAELIRLLSRHPRARLAAAGSRQGAGARLSEALPALGAGTGADADLMLEPIPCEPAVWADRGVEVVFSALPHGAFAGHARRFLEAGLRVIDLSSDFRLRSAADYTRRYGMQHPDPELLGNSVYGLTEWCGPELEAASLVANPGCYATACLLALLPAARLGLAGQGPVVINAMSGVSGAGRAASLTTHFVECGGSVAPYRVGSDHAHLGEMEQTLGLAAGSPFGALVFNPHLAPMSRGILASIAVPLTRPIGADPIDGAAEIRGEYRRAYQASPFVRVLEGAALPETRHVRGSNRCDLALRSAAGGSVLLVFSAIDNLVKGAAGQAIQNWNRMQGWPESAGLPADGWGTA